VPELWNLIPPLRNLNCNSNWQPNAMGLPDHQCHFPCKWIFVRFNKITVPCWKIQAICCSVHWFIGRYEYISTMSIIIRDLPKVLKEKVKDKGQILDSPRADDSPAAYPHTTCQICIALYKNISKISPSHKAKSRHSISF
jgi:hypothetical protein